MIIILRQQDVDWEDLLQLLHSCVVWGRRRRPQTTRWATTMYNN